MSVAPQRGGPRAFTGARDSVDGVDGLIDGSGVTGSSWFSGAGATGVRFTYSGNDLPTAFGLVGTNGAGAISFSAFDGNGNQLVSHAFSGIPNGSFGGTTAEDQYFGVTYDDGIKSIFIFNSAGDIEIDLVQYGQMFNWALMIAGLGGVGVFARRRR